MHFFKSRGIRNPIVFPQFGQKLGQELSKQIVKMSGIAGKSQSLEGRSVELKTKAQI